MKKTALMVMVSALLVVLTAGVALAVVRDGTPGDDTLVGTNRADTLDGKDGFDRVSGRGGNDVLKGGLRADVVNGGEGNDRLGGAIDDFTDGDIGSDRLNGGYGDDEIDGIDGINRETKDIITCGPGFDTVRAGSADVVASDCEKVSFTVID